MIISLATKDRLLNEPSESAPFPALALNLHPAQFLIPGGVKTDEKQGADLHRQKALCHLESASLFKLSLKIHKGSLVPKVR